MAVRLTVELISPPANSSLSSLSPRSFLRDPLMLSPLQRKTTLTLRAVDQEKFCLDPQSRPEERTISQYHARVSTDLPLDRQKIHAIVPFGKTLDNLQKRVKKLENTIHSIQNTIYSVQDTNHSLQDTNHFMQNTIHSMQMEKLNLYIGNMLVDFIDKLYESRDHSLPTGAGNDPSHSTTRHAQAAQQIEQKHLKDLDIPLKYYVALQKFSEVYDPRPVSEQK